MDVRRESVIDVRYDDQSLPDGLDLDLNGHNPLPLANPKAAIDKVLSKGTFEVHPSGACTFVYMDFE